MKEKETTLFTNIIGISPESKILDFLIDMKEFDYMKQEIMKNSNVSKKPFERVWKKFINLKVVISGGIRNKKCVFSINKHHKAIKKLIEFDHELVLEELEKMGDKKW